MKLILGDDHQMFLDALTKGLSRRGHTILGSSDRLEGLADLVIQHRPDLCVLDVDFAGHSVFTPVAAIRERAPDIALVLLSGSATGEVWAAYDAGLIDSVVSKLCDLSVLNKVIERTRAGEHLVQGFPRQPKCRQPTRGRLEFSERERAVVALLVRGASTEQMAADLGVSTHTVRTHVQNVLLKLGVNSRVKAAVTVLARGPADLVDQDMRW